MFFVQFLSPQGADMQQGTAVTWPDWYRAWVCSVTLAVLTVSGCFSRVCGPLCLSASLYSNIKYSFILLDTQ